MTEPYFVLDKCQEDKCLNYILFRTNARRTNALTNYWFGQMPGGQMPEPYFVSDKCQEDKCLDPLLVRTNARRTNARTHIIFGQMPGGQMPEPTFGPDKCQEDKCLNPQVQAFVHRGICPLQAFVLRGICPTGGQMPVQAFVLPGICLSRHLSANPQNRMNTVEGEKNPICARGRGLVRGN